MPSICGHPDVHQDDVGPVLADRRHRAARRRPTSPTTSRSSAEDRMIRSPARTRASSSTSSTLNVHHWQLGVHDEVA